MSVLDFADLTMCANKERKDGYWHYGIELYDGTDIHDGIPHPKITWIPNVMSNECKYDRKAIDPSCADCWRRA